MNKNILIFFGCLITSVLSQNEPKCICNKHYKCFLSNFESTESINNLWDLGIFCKTANWYDNVQSIEIQNSLLNEIPDILQKCQRLSSLIIKNAGIQAIDSQKFENGGYGLTTLDLSFNKIKELQKNQFENLMSIQKIDLSHNMIETIDDDAFAMSSASLTTIDLSYNQLKTFNRDWFLKSRFDNGISANFSFNKISEIVCKETIEEEIVKQLDLSHNQILKSENFYECMMRMTNLEMLDLSYNNLGTEPHLKLDTFAEIRNLQRLSLAGNNFSSIPFGLLSFKKSLIYLDLSSNNLHVSEFRLLPSLQALRNLNILDLSFNSYDFSFAYTFPRSLPSLTELGIAGIELNCHCLSLLINNLRTNKIFVMEPKNPIKNESNIEGIFCTKNDDGCKFN